LPGAESRLNSSLLPGAATFLRCLKPPARMSDMPPMKTKTSRVVSEMRVGAYQPVVTMGFWMMGKLKTRIVIGYIFA
jgi:hypothetical protein